MIPPRRGHMTIGHGPPSSALSCRSLFRRIKVNIEPDGHMPCPPAYGTPQRRVQTHDSLPQGTALESSGLAPASINVALSAIRKLAQEAADNHLLLPEQAAGVSRVPGVRGSGVSACATTTRKRSDPFSVTSNRRCDRSICSVIHFLNLSQTEPSAPWRYVLSTRNFRYLRRRGITPGVPQTGILITEGNLQRPHALGKSRGYMRKTRSTGSELKRDINR